MTMTKWICAVMIVAAACGEDEPPASDVEGCEHLEMGPYVPLTATTFKDNQTPAVANDHMAYTLTLPATGIGYVRFAAADATDYTMFLDRNVAFAVQDAASMPVALEDSATSSPACTTIMGRHTVPLGVGTYYLALGPDAGGPVNLVIEEAAVHEH